MNQSRMNQSRMKWTLTFLALSAALSLSAEDSISLTVRGKTQVLARLDRGPGVQNVTVLFLPGDGGWRGAAITMASAVASWGYETYGFDTRKYLETFSQNGLTLSRTQMGDDLRSLVGELPGGAHRPVIIVGWSQGAAMAVAAASGYPAHGRIKGIITLGLPESAVLGWDWRATLALIARREPNQPTFAVKPLLPSLTPVPLWMIHGAHDEYTSPEVERALFQSASEPKRYAEVPDADHRFGGHEDELHRSLKAGLAWIAPN